MPLGVALGPGQFQARVDAVLGELFGVAACAWVDDILVWGATKEEFIRNLKAVLARLNEANLKVSLPKSQFCAREVKWCGRLVSARGFRPLPDRLQALAQLRRPGTVAELVTLLAGTNYVRTHVPRYSEIAGPLLQLQIDAMRGSRARTNKLLSKVSLEALSRSSGCRSTLSPWTNCVGRCWRRCRWRSRMRASVWC